MATPKRKSPDTKKSTGNRKARRKSGLLTSLSWWLANTCLSGVSALSRVTTRYPMITGGTLAFCVAFGFVSANALWYQPGSHPHPLLRTRDPQSAFLFGPRPWIKTDPATTTVFRIEREDDRALSDELTQAESTQAEPPQAEPLPDDLSADTALITDIQTELQRQGLYPEKPDGKAGPRTSAAIIRFEKSVGMVETGQPSPALLAALITGSVEKAALPVERPQDDIAATDIDPVAAAIKNAQIPVVTAASFKTGKAAMSHEAAKVDLLLKIQKGLSNIAYANITVDGVPSEETRLAIRHFQKHYRLVETGEPSEIVLQKLKDIGAL